MAGDKQPLFPVKEKGSELRSSLFPLGQNGAIVSSAGATALRSTDWLANKSFAEERLPPTAPIPQVFAAAQLLESSDEEDAPQNQAASVNYADVTGLENDVRESSVAAEQAGSERDRQEGERSKHKRRRKHRSRKQDDASSEDSRERRHRKRRKDKEKQKDKTRAEAASIDKFQVPVGTERKAAVSTWVEEKPLTSEYYFDTKGDRDNLAFGSLYRLDVARYHRQPSQFVANAGAKRGGVSGLQEPEEDASARVAGENRYWGPGHALKEKSKKLKRIKALPSSGPSPPRRDFISLSDPGPQNPATTDKGSVEEGESFEDSLLRRTREFNELTRTKPQELQGWLDFAAFQDEFLNVGRKKEIVQALDKKLAIYEKALDYHPDSDELLLAYLKASAQRDDAPTLQAKWTKVLERLSGSSLLWHEYICLRKGQYSSFTVSDVRGVYAQAIAALVQERNRVRREGGGEEKLLQAERDLVRIFVDACQFEWQSGHHELATGLLQAQAEYSVFAPRVQASEASKQTLFQHFWDSGAPRIGESGALGWGAWLAKEEERLQNWNEGVRGEDEEGIQEKGGWTGWQDLKEMRGKGGTRVTQTTRGGLRTRVRRGEKRRKRPTKRY